MKIATQIIFKAEVFNHSFLNQNNDFQILVSRNYYFSYFFVCLEILINLLVLLPLGPVIPTKKHTSNSSHSFGTQSITETLARYSK